MRSRAPLGLAGFLALPIFFGSLMAASLAVERPRVVEWSRPGGHLARIFHDPTGSNEARIWLLALIPPLLLVVAGVAASYIPYGLYVTCLAACVDAIAITTRLHRWELHHTARFPYGEDNLADQTNSSSITRGEWEHDAAQTVRSFVHYTIGLAIAAAVVATFLAIRRRRGKQRPTTGAIVELDTGGAPGITG